MQPPTLASTSTRNTHPSIKAAAVHLVFASRTSQDFITPQQVVDLETWAGQRVLAALCAFSVDDNATDEIYFSISDDGDSH